MLIACHEILAKVVSAKKWLGSLALDFYKYRFLLSYIASFKLRHREHLLFLVHCEYPLPRFIILTMYILILLPTLSDTANVVDLLRLAQITSKNSQTNRCPIRPIY